MITKSRCLSYLKGNYREKGVLKRYKNVFSMLWYIINKLSMYIQESNKPLVNNGRVMFCILKCQ